MVVQEPGTTCSPLPARGPDRRQSVLQIFAPPRHIVRNCFVRRIHWLIAITNFHATNSFIYINAQCADHIKKKEKKFNTFFTIEIQRAKLNLLRSNRTNAQEPEKKKVYVFFFFLVLLKTYASNNLFRFIQTDCIRSHDQIFSSFRGAQPKKYIKYPRNREQ